MAIDHSATAMYTLQKYFRDGYTDLTNFRSMHTQYQYQTQAQYSRDSHLFTLVNHLNS